MSKAGKNAASPVWCSINQFWLLNSFLPGCSGTRETPACRHQPRAGLIVQIALKDFAPESSEKLRSFNRIEHLANAPIGSGHHVRAA